MSDTYVILLRNCSTGKVFAVEEENDNPASTCLAAYPTFLAADEAARNMPITRAWPYKIVRMP